MTPSSPNTDIVATPAGDANGTTQLIFEYQGRIPVWTPVVSRAQPQIVLDSDIRLATTIWKAGIAVRYSPLGAGRYELIVTAGDILDEHGLYSLADMSLGIFHTAAPGLEG